MGKGWLDFRSGAQRERDYREFYERVFPGGISHRRRVRARLLEMMQKKGDITYMLLYYTALKDLLIRRPGLPGTFTGSRDGGNKKEVSPSYAPDASGRIFFFRGAAVPSGTGTESGLCCS